MSNYKIFADRFGEMKKKILHVVGARPNFMKAAAVMTALNNYSGLVEQVLLHTGQHYDDNMSKIFFEQLAMDKPRYNLGVGADTQAVQTAKVMMGIEPIIEKESPDFMLVYGDVNSTLAAALVGAKMGVKIGHVEAGLRSRDYSMPEEINRLLTDRISHYLFTPSQDADYNLLAEGVNSKNVYLVGNVMIDTLIRLLPFARKPSIAEGCESGYVLVTLHRPSNVDDKNRFDQLIGVLNEISRMIVVIFPIHPRTKKRLGESGIRVSENIKLVDPLGYFEFLWLLNAAKLVVTDSGGIQEETTFLGKPCVTVRENTERPITLTVGTNLLIGKDFHNLKSVVCDILQSGGKKGAVPPLWDGGAGLRIAEIVCKNL